MNIFYIHEDSHIAAQMYSDKHVIKMIVEVAQMLCTAHRILDENTDSSLYKATHKNHPCTKWCRESKENYEWLYSHFCSLCDEYTHRYGKIHMTDFKLRKALKAPPKNIQRLGFTKPAQAMPDKYKDVNPVQAYRNFYMGEKSRFAFWTKRSKPDWYNI